MRMNYFRITTDKEKNTTAKLTKDRVLCLSNKW